MTAPKNGQRVRVVLEGEATGSDEHGFWIGRAWDTNHINPAAEHVVSVEVLRPPVRVGDVIDTAEQLDALPGSTVIVPIDTTCAALQKGFIAEWWRSNNSKQAVHARAVTLPATVVYLPDGAA